LFTREEKMALFGWSAGRRRWIKITFLALVICVVLTALGVGGALFYFSQDLPSIATLKKYEPSQATRVYARDKRIIGQFFIERRVFVPLSKMSKPLLHAILSIEDARFYEHGGFDSIRIVRAALKNMEKRRFSEGASTITQQVARSLFLTPERTLTRKVRELLLAYRMEQMLKKDEILEIYLNQIYFGHGAYGVQAASRTYFGKDVGKLNLAEAAFMAGLPKSPNAYSPYYHADKVKVRQGVVLKRMVGEGFITEKQYHAAYQQDLLFQKLHSDEDLAPHFLEQIRQDLIARYGYNTVYKGGLNVYTTLDVGMQRIANRAVQTGLRDLDKRQGYRGAAGQYAEKGGSSVGAVKTGGKPTSGKVTDGRIVQVGADFAVVQVGEVRGKILLDDMRWAGRQLRKGRLTVLEEPRASQIVKVNDLIRVKPKSGDGAFFSLEQEPVVEGSLVVIAPDTGEVLAMVGGHDFERSEYNRAVTSRRQPGSAFKPLIYATAIERGLTPATVVVDNPLIYNNRALNRVWKPENYEGKFYGPIRLREALTHSRNLATIRLLSQVGINPVIQFSHRVGIQSRLTRDLSLALGTSEVSLLELTSAYGVFANEGGRADPIFVTAVRDQKGSLLEKKKSHPKQVISRATAYVITDMLEDVIRHGTGRKAAVIGKPLAGKTGTTNEFTDAWFVGFSPDLVAGVWVGFDDRRSLGNKESGAAAALPIWMSFMQESLARLPTAHFSIPDNIVYAKIDPETGLLTPPEDETGIVELFVKGTEPTTYRSDLPPAPEQFFELEEESF
jgi:penicillin-binding protein 1A